ncbi:MAG: UvrD-helicase domain-containing protein [Proteobacteria bacterium]|nr:UvrD-helicase domain-containing protein [Pseudomonadota bacterium]
MANLSINNLQQKASNPKVSCWVNASAGSGKTKVLIDRIIRLLLHDANPERILCLTFSRAAAFEMQQRLQKRIAGFAKLSKDEIAKQLVELGEVPNEQNISQTISLNEVIQRQPVVIQTVHSFCQTLLQRQFSGDILKTSPRVMENFEESTYLHQAFQDLLKNSKAIPFIEEFLNFHSDGVLFDYLSNARHTVNNYDFNDIQDRLYVLFDIAGCPEFPKVDDTLRKYLTGLFNIVTDGTVEIDHEFTQIFLTQKGTVRSKILTKNLQNQYPEAELILKIYGEDLANYYSKKRRFDHLQKSLHFWQLQQFFRDHYKTIKQKNNLWDFHDLIEFTLQALRFDVFDQVLLDLNYRIDHMLVDEAQDTSVAQWQVIEHLVNGLFDQHNSKRSLFVVGDEKQSIYSFQGADINMYAQMHQQFKEICQPWDDVHLTTNFRSAKNILKLVDQVFAKNSSGLSQNVVSHIPWYDFAGSIEVLPLVKVEKLVTDAWPIFENAAESDEESEEQVLCTQVIDHLQHLISNGLYLECEKRNASWNDVMILMRKRGNFMSKLTSICDKRGITYTAQEPKNLMNSLVVQDLLSIVEFLLMPYNDLNLAGLLKSPWMQAVCAIDEDALFDLCHNRSGDLWAQVQEKYSSTAGLLNQLLQVIPSSAYGYFQIAYEALNVQDETLFAFMDEVFKRFNLLNLGIRDLVNHLYDFPPFYVSELSSSGMDEQGIRISTVHGAKGLESPIVVILDNGDEPNLKQDIVLYDPVAKFWFLKPPQSADTVLTSALKNHYQQAIEHEHNRLFYVGLTRAKEHLIVAGLDHEAHASSWYWPVKSRESKN